MTPEMFFEKFDQLADAPNAVPRMRRFILDLAVRGKLVAQDTKDEPAEELLIQVQTEKTRLVKSGEIKKQEQLPPVAEDAIPFSLPAGWTTSQLGDVAVCLDYMREPINGTERDLRIAGKAQSELFPYYGATQQQGWIDDFIFDAELVLLGEDGVPFFDDLRPKSYLVSGKTWVNNHAHVFRGILVSNPYVMHWLNTFNYMGRVAGSTRSKLNQAKAVDIPIPLPPLAEQKRIVAKVDELMALCDRLEAQQQERETRHAALARASLATFADAPTPANLNLLFHRSYTIPPADLRKSILTLAVQGKLVPQDPEDEPAADSLVRLGLEAIGQVLSRSNGNDDTTPFSWTQVRFEDIANIAGGVTLGRKLGNCRTVTLPYLRVANVKRGELDLSVIKEVTIRDDEVERYKLCDNDLLMTEGGDWDKVGRAAIWRNEIPICLHQNHIFRARFRSDEFSPLWLVRYFNSPAGRSYFESASKQTTNLASINMRQVKNCPVLFPPLAEQRRRCQGGPSDGPGGPVGSPACHLPRHRREAHGGRRGRTDFRGRSKLTMALWLDGKWWGPWIRTHYTKEVAGMRDAMLNHMLPALERALNDKATNADQSYDLSTVPDRADDFSVLASEQTYVILDSLARVWQSAVNMGTVMLWHLVEQQILTFHLRQVLTIHEEQSALNTPNMHKKLFQLDEFIRRLNAGGYSLEQISVWPTLEELRLVANTVKHGPGVSALKLHQRRPDLFTTSDPGYVHRPASGDDLFIMTQDLEAYFDAASAFWDEFSVLINGG